MAVQDSVQEGPQFTFREASPRTRKRITWIGAGALLLVVVALLGIKGAQFGAMMSAGKKFVPPPESVSSAKVDQMEWTGALEAIGTLVAVRGVTLSAEVPGTVREISFDSGTSVKKGAVLVRLDTSTEQAQLESARADTTLAQLALKRAHALREGGANTQADLEAAEARSKQTQAAVDTLLANIAKKTIRAPFDGRIAIRQVELGQVLSPGSPIASLQSVTPIYAEFSLPQQALAAVKVSQKVRMRTDIFPGRSWEGEVAIINPEVDVNTRNVRMRALFNNPDGRLAPGMFANVEVISGEPRPVTVVPVTSVLYAPYGDSVYVIEEKQDGGKPHATVRQKFIRVGERRGDFIAVLSGLSPGEAVVSGGGFKLRNGMSVVVNNSLAPAANVAPQPAEP
jgi:membrane fusion protein (multidrug efflux system)